MAITKRDIDIPFAATIANNIIEKINSGCGTGPAITSKKKQSVIYLVTTARSNIRATPTTKSQILTSIKRGTKLEKIGESRIGLKSNCLLGKLDIFSSPYSG